MKLQRIALILAILFFIGGLSTQYIQAHQSISYNPTPTTVQKTQTEPLRISIPQVALSSEVKPGGIVNGQWILSDIYVHFMTLDAGANKTLFYAHERQGLFVNLKRIKKGDNIFVTDNKKKITTYQVYSIESVKPTETNKLYGDPDTITLYTCDGAFDQFRLVVKAKLLNS